MTGMDGERESGKTMLSAQLDNIYIYIYIPLDKNIRPPLKMKKRILFTILGL